VHLTAPCTSQHRAPQSPVKPLAPPRRTANSFRPCPRPILPPHPPRLCLRLLPRRRRLAGACSRRSS
jgi:hypothetical protein